MKLLSRRFLSVFIAFAAFATLSSAETTDPVGAISIPVPAGTSILSAPFQLPITFQAPVQSVDGTVLTFSEVVPDLSGPHYIQIMSGTDLGRIISIDSTLDNTLTLDAAASGLASNDIVAIRKFLTVGDFGDVPNGTSVTMVSSGGIITTASYIFGQWGPSPEINIYPGEGFVINTGTPFNLVFYGAVAVEDVIYEAASGTSIIGNLDPVNGSKDILNALIANPENGATITRLVDGNVQVYSYLFGSWSPDPSEITLSTAETIVFNSGFDLDIVNSGFVVPE